MTDLPHTYTDPNGHALRVSADTITVWLDGFHEGGCPDAGVWMPADETEARVAFARAFLAAAGDAGHLVVNTEDSARAIRIRESVAAEGMRERVLDGVVDLLETHGTTDDLLNDVDRLRALPLLPDGTEAEAPAAEDFDAGWAAGHAHASADQERIAELEKQVKDLSDLVHGHGEDIGQAQAAIRGLGKIAGVPAPATAWDRKHLEYFARGGVPVDLDIVRSQLLATLEQMDVLRSEIAKKTQYIRQMGRADAGHWFGTPPEAPQAEPDLPDYIDVTSSSKGWSFRCGKCECVFHKVAETDVGARAAVRSHVATEHGEDG